MDRSTVSAAVREIRAQLAERGFAISDRPGLRPKTLEDAFAYAEAEDIELRLDGAKTQVRRPRAGLPAGGPSFPASASRFPIKATTFSDQRGRMLLAGVVRPRSHSRSDRRTQRGHRHQIFGDAMSMETATNPMRVSACTRYAVAGQTRLAAGCHCGRRLDRRSGLGPRAV
ncbi:hypothetical protein [Streptomyces sp. NPDC002521]